jgi:hypothetical protein
MNQAELNLRIAGLLELLEIRFLRGDENGSKEIAADLKEAREELARLNK